MKINWKVRLLSFLFLLDIFGFIGFAVADSGVMDLRQYEKYVEAFMAILIAGGVVTDPTTFGLSDSKRAMN